MSQKGISGKVDVGVRLNLHSTDASGHIHVQRSDDGTTSTIEREWRVPATQEQVHDPLPPTKGVKHYRVRGIGRTGCVTASSWTPWRKARGGINIGSPNVPKTPIAAEILRDGGGGILRDIISNLRDAGSAKSDLLMGTTSVQFPINHHTEKVNTTDGSTVTFADSYESPPTIVFVPQRATSQSTQFGGTAKMNMRPTNLSVSGFNPKLKLESSTGQTTTPIEDGFSVSQNTTGTEGGGVTLQNDGDVCFSNLEDANSNEATYNAFFKYSTTGLDPLNQITVHLDANDGSTSTNFTEKDSLTFSPGNSSTQEKLSFSGSLNTDFDLRGRLTYSQSPSTGELGSVTFFGESTGSAQSGVEYNRVDSAAASVPMTTGDSDSVLAQAYEKG